MEQAAEQEQLQRDMAIAQASVQRLESDPDFDGLHCIEVECGDEIPLARLQLGKIRCVPCQTRREKKR